MPELPDVVVYLEALEPRVLGRRLSGVRLFSPFVLRTVDPPITALRDRRVLTLGRMGKRIVLGFEDELFLVIHLMIAGRLRWGPPGMKAPGRIGLAAFDFDAGTLVLTEAGSKRRASLHVVAGSAGLAGFERGGLEPLETSPAEFTARLRLESHTLKRALTDPRLFSGIGNAYSDEILHAARLSPMKLTDSLSDDETERLHDATIETLETWIERLRDDAAGTFPEKVTAFREGMAVHGRYRQPCPVCGAPVQRIVYARNEANYCATCQTGGKLLSDRALARLLRDDWPKTVEDMERRLGRL